MFETIYGEIWKEIPGYEGVYEINNFGDIRSLDRFVNLSNGNKRFIKGIRMKLHEDTHGYLNVRLNKDNVSINWRVHRLVAITFIEKEDGKDYVDHINTIRTDNRVENLRWVTMTENNNNELTKYHMSLANKGLNSIKIICLNNNMIFNNMALAADYYNIDRVGISKCCSGVLKTSGIEPNTKEKLVWMYYDEYINLTEKEIKEKFLAANEPPQRKRQKIRCITTNMIFDSITEAAEFYKIGTGTICKACKKGMTSNNGIDPTQRLLWEYIKKEDE